MCHKFTYVVFIKIANKDIKIVFSAHTSFLASSPLLILFGYLAMVDAAFLVTEHEKSDYLLAKQH